MSNDFKNAADTFANWFDTEEGQQYLEIAPTLPAGQQRQATQQQQAQFQLIEIRHNGVRLIIG